MKKLLLLAALSLSGLFGPAIAFAQVITPPTVANTTQTDLLPILPRGQGNAQSQYVLLGQAVGAPSYVYNVPVTAFSLTFANNQVYFILNPAGTLATGTVTFAPNPSDGGRECVVSSQTQTAITFTANTGQTVVGAPTALVANTAACFTYVAPVATWFRN